MDQNNQWNIKDSDQKQKIEDLEDELDNMKYDEFISSSEDELDKVLTER